MWFKPINHTLGKVISPHYQLYEFWKMKKWLHWDNPNEAKLVCKSIELTMKNPYDEMRSRLGVSPIQYLYFFFLPFVNRIVNRWRESTFNHRKTIKEGDKHFVLHLKPTLGLGELVSSILATLKFPIAFPKGLHELVPINVKWLRVEDVL